ncbi:MAG: VWA domain-containing protein [Bacteroidia bacterium]|nr:VWA domain-containing protein [Bacteroidia bacterium]
MKNLFILLGLLLFTSIVSAQTRLDFTLHVIDNHSKPVAGISVTLIETTSKKRINSNTNKEGVVAFQINYGSEWSLNVAEMKNCGYIEVPESGITEETKTITYDLKHYNRINRPFVDRSTFRFVTENQIKLKDLNYTKAQALISLTILKENGSPLTNFPVNLTCFKLGKTFLGKTNTKGVANFIVPTKNEYEVDIDNIESVQYVDVVQSGVYALETTYEPTYIVENDVNDTIVQKMTNEGNGTSSRVFLKLKVDKKDGKNLFNEDVYLQMLKSNKVYKAKTNAKGEAYFLLPNKRKYMVHFRYQKDVDVLNYKDMQGISSAEASFTYNPEPKLQFPERFVPTPDNLFLIDFLDFLYKQFPEPQDDSAVRMDVSWGNDQINAQSKEAILQLGFKVKNDDGNLYGHPLNISLVVDVSGSMEGHDRLDALKKALLSYVKKLRPTDVVSLISFSDNSKILAPAQKVGNGQYLRDMIEDLQASGGTDIYKGMVDGYEQVLKNFIPTGTNRVILLTDGYGITPVDVMLAKSKEYNKKGIEMSTIGVGEGYNQSLLSLLATAGGGLISFIVDSKDILTAFEKDLTSVLSPCAKDLTVEIMYNNQIVFKQLYGHPFTKVNDKVTMNLNNVYSGLNTLALVKFDLNRPTEQIEKKPVIIKMNYFDYRKQKRVYTEEKAFLKWVSATQNFELILEAQHKKLYAIAVLNQSLKVMSEAFAKNEFQKALVEIQNTIVQIKNLYTEAKEADVEKLVNRASDYALALTRVISNSKIKN